MILLRVRPPQSHLYYIIINYCIIVFLSVKFFFFYIFLTPFLSYRDGISTRYYYYCRVGVQQSGQTEAAAAAAAWYCAIDPRTLLGTRPYYDSRGNARRNPRVTHSFASRSKRIIFHRYHYLLLLFRLCGFRWFFQIIFSRRCPPDRFYNIIVITGT